MSKVGRFGLTSFAILASLIFSFSLGGFGRTTFAQAGTASPAAASMGDCVKALGIGKAGDACVNVVHASPDAPAVDVYVDGAKALSNLAFGSSSGWVALPAGAHQIQVTPTGAEAAKAVIDANVTLEAGAAYEVAATGLVADIKAQINQVNVSAVASGNARIRVIHDSPDAPAVDVAVTGGAVLVSNLAYPTASAFLEVPAASYDLEVRVAGTTTVALPLPGVKLEAGKVYDVYAVGTLKDKTLAVLVVVSGSESSPAPSATPVS